MLQIVYLLVIPLVLVFSDAFIQEDGYSFLVTNGRDSSWIHIHNSPRFEILDCLTDFDDLPYASILVINLLGSLITKSLYLAFKWPFVNTIYQISLTILLFASILPIMSNRLGWLSKYKFIRKSKFAFRLIKLHRFIFNANFKSIAASKNQIQQRIYKLNMSYIIKHKDRYPAFFAIILTSLLTIGLATLSQNLPANKTIDFWLVVFITLLPLIGAFLWMLYVIFVDEEAEYVFFIIILAAFYILFLYLLNRFTHFVPNTIYKWPIYTEISLAGLVFPCGIFSMFY